MTITLPPDLEIAINRQLALGTFSNPIEVLREAMSRIDVDDVAERKNSILAAIAKSDEQFARGECRVFDIDELYREVLSEQTA